MTAPMEIMMVSRSNLSPPSSAEQPIIVSLISGILTRAIMSAPPTKKLVTMALENVRSLNIENSIIGSEILDSRNINKVKRTIDGTKKATI